MKIVRRKSESKISRKLQKALAIVGFLFLFVFQVGLGNAFSGQGAEFKGLEQRKQLLLKENETLRAEIASLGSLERIRREVEVSLKMKESGSDLDYLVPPKLAWR